MPNTRLTIRLDKKLRQRLNRIARDQSKRPSQIAREALETFCAQQDQGVSCYDIAHRAGLIGIAKNLPRDLSTNPRYMEGFGES
jgi:metal-responsive CopG/Arc/MetJ family transcriptional regulator